MKLKIFYSWQSDLPNRTNRGYISESLTKATKELYKNNNSITEILIDTDSREESGTPDLVSSIFTKIDSCDIFISDISIINNKTEFRLTPNPNVLLELGYASSRIGWERIICLFNTDYGKIENLPFDIRHRKPIAFKNTTGNLPKLLIENIQTIIDNYISNKQYFLSLKKEIDLALQAILIDIGLLLYFEERPKCYDYNRILHLSKEEILSDLKNRKLLGFLIFKNNQPNLAELIEFYNNQVFLSFLSPSEKIILSKVILQIRNFFKILSDESIYDKAETDENLYIIDGNKMNSENPINSYILLKRNNNETGIVLNGGILIKSKISNATTYYSIKDRNLAGLTEIIHFLTYEINNWIRTSGNFFIFNSRKINNVG